MNTTASYTPLESLLLFQSLLSQGIDAAAFLRISSLLKDNLLIKQSSEYDAGRLSPESLQKLFLHLLQEELKAEHDNTDKADHQPGQSPGSRKRKLASSPLPTLQDAFRHVEKLPILVDRLYARYRDHIVRQIRTDEERYDSLQNEIRSLEAQVAEAKDVQVEPKVEQVAHGPDDVPATASMEGPTGVKLVNGREQSTPHPPPPAPPLPLPPVGSQLHQQQQHQQPQPGQTPPPPPSASGQLPPKVKQSSQPPLQVRPHLQPQPPQSRPQHSPQLSPRPPPQQAQPLSQPTPQHPQVQHPLQPRPPPAVLPEEGRNVVGPSPQPVQPFKEAPATASPPTGFAPPQPASPALQVPAAAPNRTVASPVVGSQIQLPPRTQNGSPQVLQPPQGVGFPTLRQGPPPQLPVQGEGLQRPEGVGRGKPPPIPPPHPGPSPVPGQLKWEPLYQPHPNQAPHHRPAQLQPHPQPPGNAYQTQPQPQMPSFAAPPASQGPQQQQQIPSNQQWKQQSPSQSQSPYGSPRPLQTPPTAQQPQLVLHQPGQQPLQQSGLVSPLIGTPGSAPLPQAANRPPSEIRPVLTPQSRSPAPGQITNQGPPPPPPPARTQSPYPAYQVPLQPRPPAAASPTPPSQGPSQGPPIHQQQQQQQRVATPQAVPPGQPPVPPPYTSPTAIAPATGPGEAQRVYGAHYNLPPRSAVPDRVLQPQQHNQRSAATTTTTTPQPPSRISPVASAPQTPVPVFRPYQPLGSGTKWKLTSTPSTPGPSAGDWPSPAYEPLSPVLPPAGLPPSASKATARLPSSGPSGASAASTVPTPTLESSAGSANVPPNPGAATAASVAGPRSPEVNRAPANGTHNAETPAKRRGRQSRHVQKPGADSPAAPALQHQSGVSAKPSANAEGKHADTGLKATVIKHEETTPQPHMDVSDVATDDGGTTRRQSSRMLKRKRQDASPTPGETERDTQADMDRQEGPAPPRHVLWTRAFNKVSHSAMEQIIGHRDASLFAHQIRERDAPGYSSIVLQPQDLKSIRAAINHGNRTAAAAAAALPNGDPGTSSVWLPISEDLVPPKGIINGAQLDRELAHMFSNAIMYNPDPNRGPGPYFMRSDEEVDAEDGEDGPVLGYKVDENGIVNNARAMFVEVQKLLADMRNAEIQRGAPPPPPGATAASQPSTSDTTRSDERASATGEEDTEEVDAVGTASKRRRITRG